MSFQVRTVSIAMGSSQRNSLVIFFVIISIALTVCSKSLGCVVQFTTPGRQQYWSTALSSQPRTEKSQSSHASVPSQVLTLSACTHSATSPLAFGFQHSRNNSNISVSDVNTALPSDRSTLSGSSSPGVGNRPPTVGLHLLLSSQDYPQFSLFARGKTVSSRLSMRNCGQRSPHLILHPLTSIIQCCFKSYISQNPLLHRKSSLSCSNRLKLSNSLKLATKEGGRSKPGDLHRAFFCQLQRKREERSHLHSSPSALPISSIPLLAEEE